MLLVESTHLDTLKGTMHVHCGVLLAVTIVMIEIEISLQSIQDLSIV